MRDVTSLALVGIGGYGNSYVSALLDAPTRSDFHIAAAIDPSPKLCRRLGELQARGVEIFASMEEFYAKGRADLMVISTPLHLHAAQTCAALARGSHVLCEKPLCVTPKQAAEMQRARDGSGKTVSVGYQWSFSPAIQQLKADAMNGVLGRARRLRCLVLWPRDEVYYRRNRWAGAKVDGNGALVLDSPVNNACAHYLHNMFYVLGPKVDQSNPPARVTAELYRANGIGNYDTAAIRCITRGGAEVLFLVSHATSARRGPKFCYEFENATVEFADAPGAAITARFANGTTKSYGSPNDEKWEKLWSAIRSAKSGRSTVCGIEASMAHTQCAWAAQQSVKEIRAFAASMIRVEGVPGSRKTWVEGLTEVMERGYESFAIPSEMNVPWAQAGDEIIADDASRQLDELPV
jgi:predicted dehydrogenase